MMFVALVHNNEIIAFGLPFKNETLISTKVGVVKRLC